MTAVADLLVARHRVYAWLLAIEGVATMFTNRPEICGSGPGSWIGTDYGEREVKLGLVTPAELSYGYVWAPTGKLEEGGGSFQLVDYDGTVVELFREIEPDEDSDDLVARLSPLDDPAPSTILGELGTPIPIWDRNVGIERIGPGGERRHFWCWPTDEPAGLDHPAGLGWPAEKITDRPVVWPGRKCTLYMIVRDTDGTWPSWLDQHDGGAIVWWGKIRGYGEWRSVEHRGGEASALDIHVAGPTSWIQGAINGNRPATWLPISGSARISAELGNHLVAAWIGGTTFIIGEYGDEGEIESNREAQTFASGNTLDGATSRQEIADKLLAIVKTMATGSDFGGVLASTNSTYTPDGGPWANVTGRDVTIGNSGAQVGIRCEVSDFAWWLGLCLHVDVWATLGWDVLAQPGFLALEDTLTGACPVGGENWGEAAGAAAPPTTGYYYRRFSTIADSENFDADNGGAWRFHNALWPDGTVALRSQGGDYLRLGIGAQPCEGQLASPPQPGTEIDGTQCDAAGWWLFRGKRLTVEAYEAGEEPVDEIQVALCDWVATDDRLGIEVDGSGRATMIVRRWEDPRRFGVPRPRVEGTWVTVAGTLEAAPIAVIGGTLEGVLDRAYWLPVRLMLASGTATPDPVTLTTQPGEQHPIDQVAEDKLAGDVEVRDLGLGLPRVAVDHASWRRVAGALPGGRAGALARSMHVILGPGAADQILTEICVSRGWVPTWRREAGAATPAYGAFDPLAQLSMQDVELTISDASKAAASISPAAWRPRVQLRDAGPYDEFRLEVERHPIEGRLAREVAYTSQDPNRRHRTGKLRWEAREGGLRDPSPWVGTPLRQFYDWGDEARQRLGVVAGNYWARAVWLYTTVVDPTVAPSCWIGTVVRVTDPRAKTPQGTVGLDHIGWICEIKMHTNGALSGCKTITVALKASPVRGQKFWGPSARAYTYTAGTLTISEDWAGAQAKRPAHDDTIGFVEPSWSDIGGGPLKVRIYQSENGKTYPAEWEVTADCIGVDADAHTLTLDNVVGKIYRDMIKWVVAAPYDEQTADWALALYMPIVDAEGYYDPASKGSRL